MINWIKDLFYICRSITGPGLRRTLKYFEKINPEFKRLKFKTGKKVFDWILELLENGVGELIITSIDYEGTKKGFDLKLLEKIDKIIKVPTIFSGGAGSFKNIKDTLNFDSISGVAIASLLHLDSVRIFDIKKNIFNNYRDIFFFIVCRNNNK